MINCPCCSHQLLRHIRHHETYWYCSHCRQEMPALGQNSCSLVPLSLGQPLELFDLRRSLVTV